MSARASISANAKNKTPLECTVRSCYPALAMSFAISFFINLALLVSPLYSMQVYDLSLIHI